MSESGSRIFVGYRSLGYVSNHVPLVSRYIQRRREHLVVTCVGKVFHTYGCSKLGLLSISKAHPEDITCVAADAYLVFAASGNKIYAWRRGCELKHIYSGHAHPIRLMLPFGPHLISVDSQSNLKMWDIKTTEQALEVEFSNRQFEISAICHPATYLNKILLGSEQGSLQLWNLRSCKPVFKFVGWGSAVQCLEQSPAVDVVAVGLRSGDIYVHNLKYDETVIKFSQDWGPVTCLTFRTDGPPVLVSASGAGHVALWDLETRSLAAQMRNAHAAEVTGAKCLHGEPVLVTSSPDNTLKQWIFDLSDGGGRLLRVKEGHAEPPVRIRFYGDSGDHILSAGEDSTLRSFSTVTDLLNKSFGVASYNRKLAKKHRQMDNPVRMKPIIGFTCDTTRDRDWDNIACVHRDTTTVTTWSFGFQKMGDLKLQHPRFKQDADLRNVNATAVCLSFCGNFVFIGYDSGHVDKFNVQSGIHRGEFGCPAHPKSAVRGIVSATAMIVTGDSKGRLKFWNMSSRENIGRLKLPSEVVIMELNRDSSLLAVAMQDCSVTVIDIVGRNVVRTFEGHEGAITDMTISADSRWILTSSIDATVKVWDIPSGHLVDHFKFPAAVTSLSISPRGDFLVTSHVGDVGLYLWTNMSLYSRILLRPLSADHVAHNIEMPITSRKHLTEEEADEERTDSATDPMDLDEEVYASPEQLANDLITLAGLPNSRWLNLLNLDIIKARNKPKEAAKKAADAPFFLPTVAGLQTRFDLSAVQESDEADKTKSQILTSSLVQLTEFGKVLLKTASDEDFGVPMCMLKSMSPSSIEIEVLSLSPEGGGTPELMAQFLVMVLACVRGKKDSEAAQAYLALFMKVHSDAIAENQELVALLSEILEEEERSWSDLQSKLVSSSTLVAFYKNNVIT